MKHVLRIMLAGLFAAVPLLTQAAPGTSPVSSSNSKPSEDFEKIQIMLEYNQRLVHMTENYLKDRVKIPADYQEVADKEYLRKAKMEKPLATLKAPAKAESRPAASAPEPAAAKPRSVSTTQLKK